MFNVDTNKVLLVGRTEFKARCGRGVGNRYNGMANHKPFVGKRPAIWCRRDAEFHTYVHEVLHCIFPSKPHWWIYQATNVLIGADVWNAHRNHGGFYNRFGVPRGKTMETKREIIELGTETTLKMGLSKMFELVPVSM
jgi:hypothetical protein